MVHQQKLHVTLANIASNQARVEFSTVMHLLVEYCDAGASEIRVAGYLLRENDKRLASANLDGLERVSSVVGGRDR
jgi:hypothetical protein